MDTTGSLNHKEAVAARIKHLEAELEGALEAVSQESTIVGDMLPTPLTGDEDMMPTIRSLESEIETLKAEYNSL